MDFLRNNNLAMTQLGLGLLSGRTGQEQAAMGAQGLAGALNQNKTMQYLEKVNPQLAAEVRAGRPMASAWEEIMTQRTMAAKPKNFAFHQLDDGTYGSWDETTGQFTPLGQASKPATLTDDMREYEFAKSQGYNKPFADWQIENRRAGATNVNAGVTLPPEMGARIGLGDQFLTELPSIKDKLKGGAVDSVIGRGQLAVGMGEPAEIWRRIEAGKEALVRNLTGAGMAQAEAENQAARYQIAPTDSVETMLQKLDGLQRDLEATKAGAIGAKTGTLAAPPQQGGVVDYTDYFKQ
jgi:hypothetical protein